MFENFKTFSIDSKYYLRSIWFWYKKYIVWVNTAGYSLVSLSYDGGKNAMNLSSAAPIYIWEIKLVITVPADALVPNNAKPAADTMMTR